MQKEFLIEWSEGLDKIITKLSNNDSEVNELITLNDINFINMINIEYEGVEDMKWLTELHEVNSQEISIKLLKEYLIELKSRVDFNIPYCED